MKLTIISVGLSRTISLPGYDNVKPSITFTAELAVDDVLAKVIEHLNVQCLLYINDQIDEALEAAGQSPRFYCGTLYTAHRWEQAHAIVVLTDGVDVNDLPGEWHSITNSPVRKAFAMERARQAAKKLNWDLWNWGSLGADKAIEWWSARTWYVAYRLDRWLDHYEHEPAKIVVLPAAETWNVTDRLLQMRDNDLSYRPRQLEEILKLIPPLPFIVADDELTLRTIVADWQAANPRPEPEPDPDDNRGYDSEPPHEYES